MEDKSRQAALMLGALGVVYGDIGTSPLYALRECFSGTHGAAPTADNILGILSLILWTLCLVVSFKYLGLVMRASKQGEGGILTLLSLAIPIHQHSIRRGGRFLLVIGIFGAALLYGDGIITPAVTVLSAVEGLEVATPMFKPYVVPIAIVILISLFAVQRFGTGRVGSIFGPVMLSWFAVLGLMGLHGIIMAPEILKALSPHYGIMFLMHQGHLAFVVLGAVFLSVTGAEALYADMGHFGLQPIRKAWFFVAFPGLLLNYFGEGALLLKNPKAIENPFFMLAPEWALLPMVVLATMAAVIASQALIAGAYSLTMQGIQMGLLPRLIIRHTSHITRGQIYMPQVNLFLMLACVALVVGFESSSRLAGAYGIAVSLTMLITTLLFFSAARQLWQWHVVRAGFVCGLFLIVETAYVSANSLKILQGGWFPLVIGLLVFALMSTWLKGRQYLRNRLSNVILPFNEFLKDEGVSKARRVPGTAVFLSGNPGGTPLALLHNLKHNKVLHDRLVILTITTEEIAIVPHQDRISLERMEGNIYRIHGHYGFMEQPDVPALLRSCEPLGLKLKESDTTFFLSRETILPGTKPGMALWRRKLFAAMSRNAQSATAFFNIPPNRVVELGMQVEI